MGASSSKPRKSSKVDSTLPPPSYNETTYREPTFNQKFLDELTKALEAPRYPTAWAQTIRASDEPKWRWTCAQCRAWIFAVLTEYCDKDESFAREKAAQFEGFGANIYMTSVQRWKELYGDDIGRAINILVVQTGYQEVPNTVSLKRTHGEAWHRVKPCTK